ncbi:MAG: tetratricopeptide repeat protein [Ignavibacteriae bacterium]|nr:MAG: tetratricopeptide repeat protein [Ignavibacteriota bacterium]
MAIRSKFRAETERASIKSVNHFTDRVFYMEQFRKAFEANLYDVHNILVYYGVGGIGKSSLKKEIQKYIKENHSGAITESIDLDLSVYRQEETALYYLRKNLKDKYKISFPTFDIAYAVYWQKTHPNTSLTKENLTLFDDSSIVVSLVSTLGSIPLVGLLPGLSKAIYKSSKVLKEWWTKRGQKELYNLPELEAKDILLRLPVYFASDLKEHIRKNNSQCILLIDTYDALWENIKTEENYFLVDEWVRELVSELPEPLWIFFGREKLRWSELNSEWEQYIKQHLIGGLSEIDSKRLLSSYNIYNEDIRNIIVKASEGVPHYIDLAVDQYYQIKNNHNREPEEKDFAKTQQEVLTRFLRYLDKNEIETLKVLSIARRWDSEIFSLLIDKFNTGYPITALKSFTRFSFVKHDEDNNSYSIHKLMNEGLHSLINENIKTKIHKYLFDYYNNELNAIDVKNVTFKTYTSFIEAFYHGKNILTTEELTDWFYKKMSVFSEAAKWKELIPLTEEIVYITEKSFGNKSLEYANALEKICLLYNIIGQYAKSEKLLIEALNIFRQKKLDNTPKVIIILRELAFILSESAKFEEAIKLYKKSGEILEKNDMKVSPGYADILGNIGKILGSTGRFKEAIKLNEEALDIRRICYGENHTSIAMSMNSLGILYYLLNDFDKALDFYDKALNICKSALGEEHPLYASIINNKAIIFSQRKQNDIALSLFDKVAEIKKNIYGDQHPNYGEILGNLGVTNYFIGNYEKALFYLEKEKEIELKYFGTKHWKYIFTTRDIAAVYYRLKQYDKCLSVCFEIDENSIKEHNKDVYSELLFLKIISYKETGKYEKALPLCDSYIELPDELIKKNITDYDADILNEIIFIYEKQGLSIKAEKLRERFSIKALT